MWFGILGPVQVRDSDGREVTVGGPGVRALLARLLLDAGHVVSVARLVQDLYDDPAPAGAANALQSQVSRLRRALPVGVNLERGPAGYRLAVEPELVDMHRFMRLAAAASSALAAGDPARTVELLDEALGHWRGSALADVVDVPFAAAHVARLEERRLAAVEDRIEARLLLGHAGAVIAEARELTSAYPLRERLWAQLMRALRDSGRPAEALVAFEQARQGLVEALGMDPSPELVALHVAILRGRERGGPAAPAASPAETAVPAATEFDPAPMPGQLTRLLGRDDELTRTGALLGDTRLVTLTGPGGVGKTRLAVELAGRQVGERCFVDLAVVADAADVPSAVATALGLREAGLHGGERHALSGDRPPPVERIVAALADRELLLVVDNCEHVVAGVATLADRLLSSCPRLRILATSREPLGLTGEALCPVPGLAVPPADAAPTRMVGYAAVRLFLERAALAAPDVAVDDLAAVGHICRALDGMPLAIELAAARLRTLPVAEVADRLEDRFALLSRGSRTAAPRHRTLRAVIEWSWDLLDEHERALARRLAVFAGGATLEAITQVCGATVDVLDGLVDRSLVQASGGRYRMLETMRAYAAQQLDAAGEVERLRSAHAAYFADLAWTADGHLRGPWQLEWLARLDTERDNLHSALQWSARAGEADTALELVSALAFYWWVRGLRREAGALAGEALAAAGPQRPPGREDGHALCELLASLAGPDDPDRHDRLRRAAQVLHSLPYPPRQPFALLLSSMVAGPPAGGEAAVQALLEEKGDLLEADPWTRALSPLGLATVRMLAGDLSEAERGATVSLRRFRALGERWGMVTALGLLAEIAGARGQRTGALDYMDEALHLATELGSAIDIAEMLRVRGEGRLRAGDLDGAQEDYHRMGEEARRAGAPELWAAAHLGQAEVARQRGDAAEARRRAETALAECPTGWFSAEETRRAILDALQRL
jgi:predicted ATPase/DNA-binding SARP family transcriptional activator